jgi:acetyl-CoA/propionyl-CoA carboxylase biotin carboxyl carrier protein
MPTALPFHRAVVDDPAFAPSDPAEPFRVHTRWIETEFVNTIPPFEAAAADGSGPEPRETITVEVGGKRLEVRLPAGLSASGSPKENGARRGHRSRQTAARTGDALTAPMQGTIVKVEAVEGQRIEAGDVVVVLEAMKMEQPLTAHKSGMVTSLAAEVGQTVSGGAVVCEIRSTEEAP